MLKPSKPRPDFPLFPHRNGQWAKKFCLHGKPILKYFGPWRDDPKGETAIKDYLERKEAILAGLDNLRPALVSDTMTVVELCRRFLQSKHADLLAGNLADETFNDYTYELQLLADLVGPDARAAAMRPEAFTRYLEHLRTTRRLGPHRLGTAIRYVRAAFDHAEGNGWIPAVNFGTDFRPPNTDPESIAVRKARQGEDVEDDPIYTPAQIQWLLDHATKQFRAMLLVMLNCGMGPSDVARLKWKHIDFAPIIAVGSFGLWKGQGARATASTADNYLPPPRGGISRGPGPTWGLGILCQIFWGPCAPHLNYRRPDCRA